MSIPVRPLFSGGKLRAKLYCGEKRCPYWRGVLISGVSLERGAPRITKYDGTYIGIPSITDVWGYDREFCIYASESQWHR